MNDFKRFVLRGNVVDLAVGVVIGAAFGAVVGSLVEDLLTPLLGAVGGQPDFSDVGVTLNGSRLRIGEFLNALIAFLMIAAAIFFLVVRPVNALMDRMRTEPDSVQPTRACPECVSQIPTTARRCAFCTAEVTPA